MIKRSLTPKIISQLEKDYLPRGVILYGARQVGKTTLTEELVRHFAQNTLLISGDRKDATLDILETRDWHKMSLLLSNYQLLIIDEAQRIKDVGLVAKIILDNRKDLKVLLTGSASLDLASKVSEPLTGRAYSYHLWPISQLELSQTLSLGERISSLEERVIYGNYPKLITLPSQKEKEEYLNNLVNNYLYKDILDFGRIKNSGKIRDLLKLLAYQIGSQVSVAELATQLEISRDAVNNYINLLESSFVIFRLSGFNRNLRNEMRKMDKIYFWDTGVRNNLINQMMWKNERRDWGELWENYLIAERLKLNEYQGWRANYYFWRLNTGAELDLVEEKSGKLLGIEIKSGDKTPSVPNSWKIGYPLANFKAINTSNWNDWVIA